MNQLSLNYSLKFHSLFIIRLFFNLKNIKKITFKLHLKLTFNFHFKIFYIIFF
jgi:hypothetical protein